MRIMPKKVDSSRHFARCNRTVTLGGYFVNLITVLPSISGFFVALLANFRLFVAKRNSKHPPTGIQ